MADIFLHIGLPKTGTTTIQRMLDAAAPRLAADGVLFAGGTHHAQRLAVYDLLGQRVGGEARGEVVGCFSRLVAEMAAHPGRSIVISEEELSMARPRQVRRLVRALADHRVHVVVGVRDPARTLVSAWQQTVVNGGTTPWRDYVAAARGEDGAPASEGISFWLRHDLMKVVDTWSTAVPPERIRLVTLPAKGTPGGVLLERFAAAAELPPDPWAGLSVGARNVSLGAAELEAVRRLNLAVAGRLNTSQHRFVIEAGIRARLVGASGRPLVLPAEHLAWAREHGERDVEEVERRGLRVYGSLRDLVPGDPVEASGPALDAVDDEDLLAATQAALASMALSHGQLFRRYRRAVEERTGVRPGVVEVMGSEARAGGFRARKWVLAQTDRSPTLARAVRAHVAGTLRPRLRR